MKLKITSIATILSIFLTLFPAYTPSATQAFNATAGNQVFLPLVYSKPLENTYSLPGANPARTSWTPEEVRGNLKPLWYRPIEPYILPRVQVIAAYGALYISTAKGLYALDAATGAEKWVFPTELPLGHSPTVLDGKVYVGGFDHRLYALNASNGTLLWSFEAGAGFDTNPLVVNGKVYAGNRDGFFYAVFADGPNAGQLAWKFQTGGPVHYSAAFQEGVIFFASDDGHAYALNAQSGSLVWKSSKLPGAGFHSWWPVVYKDWVIFAGSPGYRNRSIPGPGDLQAITKEEVYPNRQVDPDGTLVGPLGAEPGDWAAGTPTIDLSKPTTTANGSTFPVTEYYEKYPWRRTFFVLNRSNGSEYTSDFDHDGKPEYAPILFFGAKGTGTRFPPVVGGDGVLYLLNNFMSNAIPGGHISGWKFGTPFVSVITTDWGASDEPHAFSAGGKLIYWKLCCDRQAGAIDVTIPNTAFARAYNAGERPPNESADPGREWGYFGYNLPDVIPGYNILTYVWEEKYSKPPGGVFGGRNGSYGWHGDESPPIPYQGKVYSIQSNAVVAFGPNSGPPTQLPLVKTVSPPARDYPQKSDQQLRTLLSSEVQKIIASGHLRPAYLSSGLFDSKGGVCGDDLIEYWHHPGDIHTTLIRALPYLPADLQRQAKTYLQNEFKAYPPYQFNHIGYRDGTARELYDLPPEVEADMANFGPRAKNNIFTSWSFAPHSFYAMWKYAQTFGDAKSIFDSGKDNLEAPPSDAVLAEMPYVHNAFIAGYFGYLEIEKLAGYPQSADKKAQLDRLLALRASSFSKDVPDSYFLDENKYYCRALNVSRNFMYLVPELAQYLRLNALGKVQEALVEYQRVAPYWFAPNIETVFAEGVNNQLYDTHAIFQAKAMILGEPRQELSKYIDSPAVHVGDLFFIDNLVAAIEAGH